MSSALKIAPGLTLPINAVTQKLAMLGRTGSGKTYGATKLAEEMHDAGAQIVALDPVGVWYGLRLAANGRDPGIAIPVFGGLHGAVPLEREAKAKPAPVTAPAKTERVEVPILKDSHIASLEKVAGQVAAVGEKSASQFTAAVDKFAGVAGEIVAELKRLRNGHHPPPSLEKPHVSSRPVIQRPIVKREAPPAGDLGTGGLRRILIALAQCPAGLSAKQIGVRAGMSSSSGTFGTYLGKARSSGWIEGSRDRLIITDDGLSALGSYESLPTGRELLEYWLRDLGDSGAGRMLSALVEAGKALTAEELGAAAGISHTSGTFGTYLGKLRTLELVTGSRSSLAASEDLF